MPPISSKMKGPFTLKNREVDERRRASLHYVDLSDLVVFTKEDLARELNKIPELKLRADDDGILSRQECLKRMPSLNIKDTTGDDVNLSSSTSHSKHRRRSSALSIVSSASRSTSPVADAKQFNSFYQLSQQLSKMDTKANSLYPFDNPIPPALRSIEVKDLIYTDIDWKMLTSIRPESKTDEDFFTRFIECARLHEKLKLTEFNKTKDREARQSKLGLKFKSTDLSEELMNLHISTDYNYDDYARENVDEDGEIANDAQENANELVAKLLGETPLEMTDGDANQKKNQSLDHRTVDGESINLKQVIAKSRGRKKAMMLVSELTKKRKSKNTSEQEKSSSDVNTSSRVNKFASGIVDNEAPTIVITSSR